MTLAAVDHIGTFNQTSLGLALIRVVLGLTLAAHGYNKFFGGGRIPGTARWFDSMGMKPNGRVHAILAASNELGGGLLFAAGFLTPLAAAAIVGLMVVAAWTVHRSAGFFIVKSGWEYNLILAVVAVGVAVTGPGRYSVDWKLGLDFAFRPGLDFVLSAVLGVVAGAGLLAACYRPPAPAPSDA
ncbi:MAG: DoxX family protein [Actinomycetota bacterium]|nr:DoxX family protein [Actinomycetota bacterium]